MVYLFSFILFIITSITMIIVNIITFLIVSIYFKEHDFSK